VNSPQRCVYVMPCGSNIDVARCGWDVKNMSNGKEMFRYAQHDKIPMSLRASSASVAINKQRIPSERS
ncbi:MAG: hypothetical protein K2N20_02665, partial [Helicobacter sp.]|nr:hypothetical protein [Helicobacter sp.]